MLDTTSALVVGLAGGFAFLAIIICAASLVVKLPWWGMRQRKISRFQSEKKTFAVTSVDLLCKVIEGLAVTSPTLHPSRARGAHDRSFLLAAAEHQNLPLRFQPDKFYGAISPHRRADRSHSSISSTESFVSSVHRNSMFDMVSSSLHRDSQNISTKHGFLAPPTIRPRSGSTSLLHDLAKTNYDGLTTPVPGFLSVIRPQPLTKQIETTLSRESPSDLQKHSSGVATGAFEVFDTLEEQKFESKDGKDTDFPCEESAPQKRPVQYSRRTSIAVAQTQNYSTAELGVGLFELVGMMGLNFSKSTNNSPQKKCMESISTVTSFIPRYLPEPPRFSLKEAPGGLLAYRLFIDATGKHNLTVRVHLFAAKNVITQRPWKNTNYAVRSELIGFRSHFVQTSGYVTTTCGSPQFFQANPSILDFVLDCEGKSFSESNEEVKLRFSILEFISKRPTERSLVIAKREHRFTHETLKGKSTFSTEPRWEQCTPQQEVLQMTADVLTTLAFKDADGSLRFELQEIRNLTYSLVYPEQSRRTIIADLTPVKLRLRASFVSNGKSIRVRKGFCLHLPVGLFDKSSADDGNVSVDGCASKPLVLKDLVGVNSERMFRFGVPLQRPSLFNDDDMRRTGFAPVAWRIMLYFVLILESPNRLESRRVRAIGRCCLGSSEEPQTSSDSPNLPAALPLFNLAISSAQNYVSQWVHVE
uniref:Uncharacterized protein n=1 Tax=Schistocephalus solidus TaxID=70667 RepID=A0A0X3PMC5_SCHSO